MDDPKTFSIFDLDSGNSVTFFPDLSEAQECLRGMLSEHPEHAADYAIIGYNKGGEAVMNVPGKSLLSAV